MTMTEIVLFKASSGQIDVRVANDNIWITHAQLALLFGHDRGMIDRHLRTIFADGKLDAKSNVQNMHSAPADKLTVDEP